MHYYPHHIVDFDKATRHLTRIERSIYRDLIELYYDTESQIPLDLNAVCRKIIARGNEESTAVEQVLNEFFTQTPTGYYHDRCEEEIEKYKTSNTQKAAAGRASAAAKAEKRAKALNGCSTSVEQTFNGTPTNHEPLTTNEEPITNLKDIAPQAAPPATPPKKSRKTGSRLPDDWRPTQDYVDAAMQLNPDYTREWFSSTAHKFRDYWIAKTGKDATKADWLATWRNWVRNDLEFNKGKKNAGNKQLDNDNTDWADRVFGSPTSSHPSEQDFSFLEGDFSSVGIGDQGSGLPEPG